MMPPLDGWRTLRRVNDDNLLLLLLLLEDVVVLLVMMDDVIEYFPSMDIVR